MAFKGTLKEFKVPDILQLFSLQSKTGILTFTSSDGFITLIFEDGKIVGVDAFPKKLGMRVGSVLVKQDLISDEMLQRALAIQKRTNQKIGEILTGMGLVGEEQIHEALENQAVQIVLSLFKWKKGEYNFKVLDYIDDSLRSIKPMPTDNLIMEGVQMLDEWPLIKELIPNDKLVFGPLPIESKDIQIIEEDKDDVPQNDKIYLSETEANILKYINGKNSVRDLVELGIFTEYKVYKSLYNLLKKNIVERKERVEVEEKIDERVLEEIILKTNRKMSLMASLLLIILVILFIVNFFRPLHPIKKGNLILKENLFHTVVTDTKNN